MTKVARALLVLAMAAAAEAQIPGGNIFFGYSNAGGEIGPSNQKNLNGWEASLEGKFLPFLGAVLDLSEHFGSGNVLICSVGCTAGHVDTRRYMFMLGPRLSISVGKFTPFAQALFGAGHVTNSAFLGSDTSFATAIGGGLDYKLIKGLAWRFQGDELHTRFYDRTQNHFRFSTGIVLRF